MWRRILAEKASRSSGPVRIMEVCGTHTHAIARYDLRSLLPSHVTLISGPGCPVCVSGAAFIEKIRYLLHQGVRVALFGDLLRIPGSRGTLRGEKGIKVVYSPEDALTFALEDPSRQVVFAAVGFAPTLSAAAALMADAEQKMPGNFSILSDFKSIRPVLGTLCCARNISGLLLPGHVASITGSDYFKYLGVPGAVAGFGSINILHSLKLLLEAVSSGEKDFLVNNYPEAVRPRGNTRAIELTERFFRKAPGIWRGMGEIPESGWQLKDEYSAFDAEKVYQIPDLQVAEDPACRCGEVLTGAIAPEACPLFGKVCTPSHPAGACMASGEGSCAAAFISREEV